MPLLVLTVDYMLLEAGPIAHSERHFFKLKFLNFKSTHHRNERYRIILGNLDNDTDFKFQELKFMSAKFKCRRRIGL
jgi:hypothetical protein